MQTDDNSLQQFLDRILKIDPTRLNMFGGGYPGFQGSTAIIGSSGSAAEVIASLRTAARQFARECSLQKPDRTTVLQAAKEVETSLTLLHTLAVLNDADYGAMLDEMYGLVDQRAPQLPNK